MNASATRGVGNSTRASPHRTRLEKQLETLPLNAGRKGFAAGGFGRLGVDEART
jgi:hypothetical protein